ncbi:MAG: hypothetical protein ACQEQE_07780 [Bacillota bacterium]
MGNINKFIFKMLLLAVILTAFILFFYSYNNINKLYKLSKQSYINDKISYKNNKKVENLIYGYEIKFKLLDKPIYKIYINNILVDKNFNLENIEDKKKYKIKYIFKNSNLMKIKYTRKD